MHALKYSRQRESIKRFLLSRYDHPTADTIYLHVKEEFPNISLGTVYRNLALLTEIGEVVKITGDGPDRYDGHIEPHSHFLCRECHALIDLYVDGEEQVDSLAQEAFGGRIEGHSVQYHGLCPECMKKLEVS